MPARSIWVVGSAAVLVGFALAHSLEDFVYGIPAKFGFETAPAAALVGGAFAVHVILIALAARDRVTGYLGNFLVALVWLIAAALDHLQELLFVSPYRAGTLSKVFILGLLLSALLLAGTSFAAWLETRRERHRIWR